MNIFYVTSSVQCTSMLTSLRFETCRYKFPMASDWIQNIEPINFQKLWQITKQDKLFVNDIKNTRMPKKHCWLTKLTFQSTYLKSPNTYMRFPYFIHDFYGKTLLRFYQFWLEGYGMEKLKYQCNLHKFEGTSLYPMCTYYGHH